jgi:periplasmic divalent cation tolerance protein
MNQYDILYITASSTVEAKIIAQILIEERLIGCANIFNQVTSIYRYQDDIKEEQEVILIAKTIHTNIETIIKRVKELHSYECPCIITLPITKGNPEYLSWLYEVIN